MSSKEHTRRQATRRGARSALFGAVMVCVAGVVGASPAAAGLTHALVVEKVVVGDLPPGTEFTVVVECTFEEFGRMELVFTGPGSETFDVGGELPNECTVTEPGTGGASSVSFACEGDPGASECEGDNVLSIFEAGQSTITVTNTFAPPAPPTSAPPPEPPTAPVVTAGPRFTG